MNTTAQGDAYEDKVFLLVKRLIADGTLAVGKHYSVHQKKTYPIDFGKDSFIADVSVEVTNPHCNNEISNVLIFECKDLSRKLDKSDYFELRGKMTNFPYAYKRYFVTPHGYSQPVIDGSKQLGIGLIVWSGQGEEQWVAPRSLNELEQRELNFSILHGESAASCFPLVYDDNCFLTFGEMLRQHDIPLNLPKLKPPYLPRPKVCEIVNELINSHAFISIGTPNYEDKLVALLGIRVVFKDLPESHNGQYDATNNIIVMPNWLIAHPNRLRFSLAHELGHAYLHRVKLKQYESFFSPGNPLAFNPPVSEIRLFNVQANDFASYLLMPDGEFRYAVSLLFKQYRLNRIPFIIDNQKGKFPIYYSMVDSLAYHFQVSKEHVKSRLQKDKFVEITRQPNRIGNIIRGY